GTPGEGAEKGLDAAFNPPLSSADTPGYPEVRPGLPPRSRGVIALVEENCTVCMLCARECPDWCIYIDSHKETTPAAGGGRPRAHNVLDRFAIDFSLCMYCGICIEVCPFDALFWSPEFEYAEYDIRELLHEKDRLGGWAATVPPPPAHEANAEPPKEIGAAARGAARPGHGRPAPGAPGRPGPAEPPAGAGPRPGAGPDGPDALPGGPPPRPARAPHSAVRAIRPPGSLPKKQPPAGPGPENS
ncbi:4Fe-4S binding protein, partial [Sphaerisporangium rufum]|uniref:4Fe-4S binding protein n=1 Tax=Sphaerisporangium rufum TaxID=1381558 RepID=UPI001EF2014B